MRIVSAFVVVSITGGALPLACGQALRGASSPVNAAAKVADKLAASQTDAHADAHAVGSAEYFPMFFADLPEGDKAVSSGGWYFSPSSSSHYDNWMKVPDEKAPVRKEAEDNSAPVGDKAVSSGGWYFSLSSSSHYNNWRVLGSTSEEEHNVPTVSAAAGSKDVTATEDDTKQAQPATAGGDKAVSSGGWYFSPSSSSHYNNW